jgi:nucleotide-binding universal stress UspA family protein
MGSLPHTAVFDVRSTILDVIGEETPDLVAMGTRGLGGLRRVLGSTARAVIDHSPCSVLIARSGD